uniref:T9SS type A sorting domain-containing protein n=1 Tax=uncultured Croceitalea sp. TaxID=1798908 RepID=UPI003305F1CC
EVKCYEKAEWNAQTCMWDISGDQPPIPEIQCYESAVFNEQTCEWDIEGEMPEEPETKCYETAIWNTDTCEWDVIEDDDTSCDGGSIDQCETAFAKLSNDNAICFEDIQGFNSPRWGWTNQLSTSTSSYSMDLYAAAGQCDISKGALIGQVTVTYADGMVDVAVTTNSGYDMTVAHLYVGQEQLPLGNNNRPTVAPGQYPYQDTISGRFTTYTFEDIPVNTMGSYYVILHVEVCPTGVEPEETENARIPNAKTNQAMQLKAYPVRFKDRLNLNVESSFKSNATIQVYDGNGRMIKDFGVRQLKIGKNDIELYVGDVSAGMYFIKINNGYENNSIKVLGE